MQLVSFFVFSFFVVLSAVGVLADQPWGWWNAWAGARDAPLLNCLSRDTTLGGLAPSWTLHNNLSGVELFDFLGQIKIVNLTSCDFLRLKWDRLREVDQNGVVLKSFRLNGLTQPFLWFSRPQQGTLNGVPYQRIDIAGDLLSTQLFDELLQSQLTVAQLPHVNISVYLFQTPVVVQNGPASAYVPVGASELKFTIQIKNWPFASTNSSLQFGVTITRNVDYRQFFDRLEAISDDVRWWLRNYNSNVTIAHIGPGRLTSPLLAWLDYEIDQLRRPVQINTTSYTAQNTFAMQWTFPWFNKSLTYDPSFSAADTLPVLAASTTGNGAANNIAPITGLTALLALFAVAFAMKN